VKIIFFCEEWRDRIQNEKMSSQVLPILLGIVEMGVECDYSDELTKRILNLNEANQRTAAELSNLSKSEQFQLVNSVIFNLAQLSPYAFVKKILEESMFDNTEEKRAERDKALQEQKLAFEMWSEADWNMEIKKETPSFLPNKYTITWDFVTLKNKYQVKLFFVPFTGQTKIFINDNLLSEQSFAFRTSLWWTHTVETDYTIVVCIDDNLGPIGFELLINELIFKTAKSRWIQARSKTIKS
jgi:hypothetical protein